jgi:urea carboxylase-associated protein 2
MSSTATTHAAREHARAQAAAAEERYFRSTPIAEVGVLWRETVEAGNYAVRVLPRGSRLHLTDTDGDTSVQLLVFNHHQRAERLNVPDTVKVQWQAYLGSGQLLLSDMGRVLMSFESDTSAGHDTFNAMSNRAWNDAKYGDGSVHGAAPNARDRFAVALAKAGLGRRDIGPSVNLFKSVFVEPDGSFTWRGDTSTAGSEVVLRADMDVLVALTVTPHVLDPRPDYVVTPLDITARAGEPAGFDDPIRVSTPEARRAFENSEDWFLTRHDTTTTPEGQS